MSILYHYCTVLASSNVTDFKIISSASNLFSASYHVVLNEEFYLFIYVLSIVFINA